jgi:histidinol-phosphate aminotransferase
MNDSPAGWIKPSVRSLAPYTLAVTEAPIKLNQNESPVDVPAWFRQEVLDACAARSWNRYPDFYPADVLEGIGAWHGVDARWVMIGNGSNELIAALLQALVEPGVRVAHPSPTFTLYAMMIAASGGEAVPVPLRASDFSYPVDAWQALADRGDTHLLICSPNNPTGSVLDADTVLRLARATPRLVIVDEAYVQFGPHDHASLVREQPNLVVLRTLSKALGLAGVRLGYAVAHPDLVQEVTKVKLPYNVGILGLEVARALVRHPEVMDAAVDQVRAARSALREALVRRPGVEVFDGHANFVLIRVADPGAWYRGLLARGILIRNVSSAPGLAGCLRLSVGTDAENAALLQGIDALILEPPGPA